MPNSSNKSLNRLRHGIPLGLMGCWVLNLLAVRFADDAIAWEVQNFSKSALYAIAASWALLLLSYRELRVKCFAAALAGGAWADAVWVAQYYVFGWHGYNKWLLWVLAWSIISSAYYWLRSYDEPDLELDDEHAFLLRLKPKGPQSFIVSLLGLMGPFGGYAIFYKGHIYAFRRGYFSRFYMPYNLMSRYHVSNAKIASDEMLGNLDRLIGSKWSLFNNCLQLKVIWNAERNARGY